MYWNLDKVIVAQNEALPIDWKKVFRHERMLAEVEHARELRRAGIS